MFVQIQDNVDTISVPPQSRLKDNLRKRGGICSFIIFKRASFVQVQDNFDTTGALPQPRVKR